MRGESTIGLQSTPCLQFRGEFGVPRGVVQRLRFVRGSTFVVVYGACMTERVGLWWCDRHG